MLDRIAYTANRLKYVSWVPLLVYKAKHNYKAVLVFETPCAKQVADICRAW